MEGLGLLRFQHIIKLETLKNAIITSSDSVVSGLIGSGEDKKLKKIANSLRINWPATLEDIEKLRKY
jgi:hypothetical protein